jgi:hypothetical protein
MYKLKPIWPQPSIRGVYYVQAEHTKLVKIGVASNIRARVSTMSTDCPHELLLLGHEPGDIRYERHVHSIFSALRVRGEWFSLRAPLVRHIASLDPSRTEVVRRPKLITTARFTADKIGPDRMARYEVDDELFLRDMLETLKIQACRVFDLAVQLGIEKRPNGRESTAYRRLIVAFKKLGAAGVLVRDGQKWRLVGSAGVDHAT